jgi:uncharacterized protein RhaS with RHS repeats
VYTYDDSGNMVHDESYAYGYDPENRLVKVKKSGSLPPLTLAEAMELPLPFTTGGDADWTGIYTDWYSGGDCARSGDLDEDQSYEITGSGAHTLRWTYVYDGDHCIAEYDASDNLRRRYIYGPGVDEPICMIEKTGSCTGTYYYHFDGLGSVVALTDSSRNTVQVYDYDVYGRVSALDENHPNRFLFTGREYDKETGLYYTTAPATTTPRSVGSSRPTRWGMGRG